MASALRINLVATGPVECHLSLQINCGLEMALNSDRFESVAVVNPDEGIYVEMEGIMEV